MADYNKNSVKINRGIVKDSSNKNISTVEEMLTKEAQCGCSIDCCYGILTLPNWNDVADQREDGWGVAIIDGALVADTVANLKATIDAIKNA
jgi:hypothetical protein